MPARSALLAFCAVVCAGSARADLTLDGKTGELALTEGLVIRDVGSWGRRVINPDAVTGAMAAGTLGTPKEGDRLARPEVLHDGDRPWTSAAADEKGEFAGLHRGSYILCTVKSETDRVMVLEAAGDDMVYVNGEPHAGDPYSHGYLHIPVALHKGANQFLFAHAGRGAMKARLVAPPAPVFVDTDDLTLPSVISDKPEEYLLGAPVVNAGGAARTVLVSVLPDIRDGPPHEERIDLPPLSVLKAPLHAMLWKTKGQAAVRATIIIRDGAGDEDGTGKPARSELWRGTIHLQAKSPDEPHSRTFISEIDGSAQYAAITPPAGAGAVEHPGLVVSLHGAAVEAWKQAPCYAPKPDFVIVCPTNRRPYGFDWEDWGRADAIEAMDHAKEWYHTDPYRQYLTGHSMGGHGAWQLGVLLPERFAVVGPSAGWLTFDTYASQRGEPTETAESQIQGMFRRASASSDTLALMPNLMDRGVYILHGEKDDNVPVEQARLAKKELERLGVPFTYYEQPGAGHWWDDGEKTGGTACVDWAPMFEMFREHTLPKVGEQNEFHVTMLQAGVALPPGDGVRILRAEHPGRVAKADVRVEREPAGGGKVKITCENAAEISLGEQVTPSPAFTVEIEGRSFKASRHGSHVLLVKRPGSPWEDAGADPAFTGSVSAEACPPLGPFKNAFTHRFVLVYGTHGTAAENAWSLARARYDAEQWWYRGNGLAVMISDDEFLSRLDAGKVAGNAAVYGNSQSNAAAERLTRGQAVQVSREKVTVGGRSVSGEDLGVLTVGTFRGPSGPCMYALVGGTGLSGMRATDRMLYLLSGVGIPDVCVIRTAFWSRGAAGVECAGFWNPDFGADHAEIVWRDGGPSAGKK